MNRDAYLIIYRRRSERNNTTLLTFSKLTKHHTHLDLKTIEKKIGSRCSLQLSVETYKYIHTRLIERPKQRQKQIYIHTNTYIHGSIYILQIHVHNQTYNSQNSRKQIHIYTYIHGSTRIRKSPQSNI